ALRALLGPDPWWRDIYALTWDVVAAHGPDAVVELLAAHLDSSGFGGIVLDERLPATLQADAYVEALFTFTTAVGAGRGVIRLLPDDTNNWRAWTVSTSLEGLTDHPGLEVAIRDLQRDEYNVAATPGQRRIEVDRRRTRADFADQDPTVLIIGGGHCGLFLAARLGHLGVNALVVDRGQRIGDTWRHRYSGLVLHETKWSTQFPYMTFPDPWPLLTPKDQLADWMECYARFTDLDVWTDATARRARYDARAGRWTVDVDRSGASRTLRPRHLVLATGNHGLPQVPSIPGIEAFTGAVHHSSSHVGGAGLNGKEVVVVGAGSSALDVAQDAYEHGAHVTVVQRGPTHVLSQRHGIPAFHGAYYGESSPPIEEADLLANSMPLQLAFNLAPYVTDMIATSDADMLENLERSGFATTPGPSRTGMMHATYTRAGGYYIDKGAAQLIIDHKIAVRHGEVVALTADGAVLEDGTTVPADTLVLCTGYQNMREAARPLLGDDITDELATVWGLDPNGELRTTFRHCGHERLWFAAGGFRDARFYSKGLALMIVAIEAGILDPGISITRRTTRADTGSHPTVGAAAVPDRTHTPA
ncbi:MAG: flavin-containing monooxygenase, partial [Angustibacter sp.]